MLFWERYGGFLLLRRHWDYNSIIYFGCLLKLRPPSWCSHHSSPFLSPSSCHSPPPSACLPAWSKMAPFAPKSRHRDFDPSLLQYRNLLCQMQRLSTLTWRISMAPTTIILCLLSWRKGRVSSCVIAMIINESAINCKLWNIFCISRFSNRLQWCLSDQIQIICASRNTCLGYRWKEILWLSLR